MSDLKSQFEAAVEYVGSASGNFKPSQDLKLEMYGLFKQATEGDVKGKKPGFTDFVGKAKYSAWKKIKGMPSQEAMQKYFDIVEELKEKHG